MSGPTHYSYEEGHRFFTSLTACMVDFLALECPTDPGRWPKKVKITKYQQPEVTNEDIEAFADMLSDHLEDALNDDHDFISLEDDDFGRTPNIPSEMLAWIKNKLVERGKRLEEVGTETIVIRDWVREHHPEWLVDGVRFTAHPQGWDHDHD